jgi:AbrB family looped-hinge helix DNA binding protein
MKVAFLFTMQTKVSTNGQVVLPSALRERFGLRPRDLLEGKLEGGLFLRMVALGPAPRVGSTVMGSMNI